MTNEQRAAIRELVDKLDSEYMKKVEEADKKGDKLDVLLNMYASSAVLKLSIAILELDRDGKI